MLVRFDSPRFCDNMMEDFFATDRLPVRTQYPAIDIVEQENDFVVNVDAPGVKKEDIKITFENNILTVSGSRKPQELPENVQVLLNEVRSGEFSRTIKFRQEVDTEKMSAELNNGVLTITLPKTEAVKAREISIK
jgi:HSP20 family protein